MTGDRLRAWADAWWPTALAAAVLAATVWAELPQLDGDQRAVSWASIPVGAGFAVTAAVLWHSREQRGNALLFQLFGLVWVVERLAFRGVGWLSAPAYLVAAEVDVLAAACLLRYPGRRLERVDRLFVQVSAGLAVLLRLPVVLTSTRDQLALQPGGAWPGRFNDTGLSGLFLTVQGLWLGLSALVFIALLVRRWRRLVPIERRILSPILATAVLGGCVAVPSLLSGWLTESGRETLVLVRCLVTLLVTLSFIVSAIQLLLARTALLRLVSQLDTTSNVTVVQDALREALVDPGLEVWYHLPDAGGYVDGAGDVREPAAAGDRMFLETQTADGAPLAAVVADPRLQRHRGLVDAAVTVSRFALENARLEAGLRAQLRAVRDARARLLATGLEERRRLERDLHDGAQQRLLALTMRLSAIEATADRRTATAVAGVREELHLALDELRNLARGIYPAVLTQAGLAPALEAVTERLPVAVHATVPTRRWAPDVESAAYLVVCEALTNVVRHAGPCRVDLLVEDSPDDLHITVVDDGNGSADLQGPQALAKMHDRLGALGGRLAVSSHVGGGTVLEAWIPCA